MSEEYKNNEQEQENRNPENEINRDDDDNNVAGKIGFFVCAVIIIIGLKFLM